MRIVAIRTSSFQADGRVYPGRDAPVLEPARGDGLGLRVELHGLLAVGAQIAELRAARAGEAEEGDGHGNRYVDAHLPHVDLVLELARDGSALGEDPGAVAERIRVDQCDRSIEV